MKNLTNLIILLFVNQFVFAQKLSKENIIVKQGDKIYEVNEIEKTLELEAKPFSIQFLNKPYQEKKELFYAAQAVLTNDRIEGIKIGDTIDEISFFEPGTGFAAENGELFYPYFSDEGHQYLYFKNKKDKRVQKIGNIGEWDIYEWNLKGVYRYDAEMDWNIYNSNEIDILFIVDQNLNGKIDQGELHNLKIIFKKLLLQAID